MYIEYFRKAAGILLVSDAKIFDIIYQLSPLLECDPTGDLTFLWETNVGSHSNKGDNCIISWLSNLLVEETGVPGENHRSVASH